MFMGQWKCFSWNIHHTVSRSVLKTLHLFQLDTFFSIYWYFSFQYILYYKVFQCDYFIFINHQQGYVISWQIKQLYYSFIISKILVYIFDIFYLTKFWNSMEKSLSHKMCYTPGIFDNIFRWHFFLEIDISMIFRGHKHIIITHCC
jgi:hypothetical protein